MACNVCFNDPTSNAHCAQQKNIPIYITLYIIVLTNDPLLLLLLDKNRNANVNDIIVWRVQTFFFSFLSNSILIGCVCVCVCEECSLRVL